MINIAVIGATGLVGNEILKVLEEFDLPIQNLYLSASEKSYGNKISFKDNNFDILPIDTVLNLKPDIAIFSAGSEVSKKYAPLFAEKGTFVIDNSSQWRLFEHVPLVVPEINAETITAETKIIANPNCSTIQMVVAIAPLHKQYIIKRIVVSTYQSVSGTGMKAVQQLMNERNGISGEIVYPHPIDLNCFPHAGTFLKNGYTTEEMKLVNETRKILQCQKIQITPTVVRIPVLRGHSESINLEFEKPFELSDIYNLLKNKNGIVVLDDPHKNEYPTPLKVQGKNEVYVGRIRRDESISNGLNIWIVADNLRKGAATNAVQIAQYLYNKFLS